MTRYEPWSQAARGQLYANHAGFYLLATVGSGWMEKRSGPVCVSDGEGFCAYGAEERVLRQNQVVGEWQQIQSFFPELGT